MLLDNMIASGAFPYGYDAKDGTVQSGYAFWKQNLAERSVRLFDWENTGDIPEDEFEKIIMFNGMGFGTKVKKTGKHVLLNCNYGGDPTYYYDRWESVMVRSPLYSGEAKPGRDGVLFRNNSMCTSILPLIHRYAVLLAHTDTTYIDTLINARDASGIPVVQTEEQLNSYIEHRNAIANGKIKPVSDTAMLGVTFATSNSSVAINPKDILECRQNLLCAFYNDIGVRAHQTKKSNMIQAEVGQDDQMLLLNLDDMLESRKKAADEYNARYGTNLTVDKSKELKEMEVNGYGENFNPGTVQNSTEQ